MRIGGRRLADIIAEEKPKAKHRKADIRHAAEQGGDLRRAERTVVEETPPAAPATEELTEKELLRGLLRG